MKHVLILPSSFPTPSNQMRGIFFQSFARAMALDCKIGVLAPVYESVRNFGKVKLPKSIQTIEKDDYVLNYLQKFNWLGKNDLYIQRNYIKSIEQLYQFYVKSHGKPDLVHAHVGIWGGWGALYLKERYKIPFVLTEHSSEILKNTISPSRRLKYQEIINGAEKIVAVGHALGNMITEQYGTEVIVIPNMIDVERFRIEENEVKLNQIIAVGSLIHVKRFDNLIKAFAECAQVDEKLNLKIIGDGPLKIEIQNLCKTLKIEAKVIFAGRVPNEDLPKHYNQSRLLVSSSDFETFGVSLIEGMACGLPVVATKSGGPQEFIDESNGIMCEKNDVSALTEAMKSMLESLDQYDSSSISQKVSMNFSEELIRKKYLELYESISA